MSGAEPPPQGGGGIGLSWMTELSRALDQGVQAAGTFLEVQTRRCSGATHRTGLTRRALRPRPGGAQTNSALLANTLALDKLSEFDGVEVRSKLPQLPTVQRSEPCGAPPRLRLCRLGSKLERAQAATSC